MNYKAQLKMLSVGIEALSFIPVFKSAIYTVETGHQAFKFNKISGVREKTFTEGLHLKIPFLEKVVDYNVKATPTMVQSKTGSHDLQ